MLLIRKNKVYFFLSLILLLGFALRVYRVQHVLGFYFDQGRDANVIWDLWFNRKIFLTGPTTGIAGILRGPFYYYLIAPIYVLFGWDPIWPAILLALLSVVAIYFLYYLAARIDNWQAGIMAALLASFSFAIVMASRWLSNPTPMLLLSMLLVWGMYKVHEGKDVYWVFISLIAGLSLSSFGSAGEVFYFPALGVFLLWQYKRKNFPNINIIIYSCLTLLFTALPQILFDIRHQGILRHNVEKFLLEEQSFKVSFWEVIQARALFYYDVFSSKLFHWRRDRELILLLAVAIFFLKNIKTFWKNDYVKIILLLLISPLIGLLFFQGNFGNIYDYYLTGYYLIFILLVAVVLSSIWKSYWGKSFVLIFFIVFFANNFPFIKYKITDGVDGPQTIGFKNQKQAIDWIYKDADGQPFNVDVYVPPVIPHAYDYLFRWYGGRVHGYEPSAQNIELLYILTEVNPVHPLLVRDWYARQDGIGKVEKEAVFGGITVQRRTRY